MAIGSSLQEEVGRPSDPDSPEATDEFLSRLILMALRQEHLQGISVVLRMIAERFDASGCALWELGSQPNEGTLFILAEWFEDGRFMGIHDLSLEHSVSGLAISTGKPQAIKDLEDSRVRHRHEVLERLRIENLVASPVGFEVGGSGTLTLYRRKARAWSGIDLTQLQCLAPPVSALYEALHNRVSSSVVQDVNRLLQRHPIATAKTVMSRGQVLGIVGDLAQLIEKTFRCIEVSIFLRDPTIDGKTVPMAATTWERPDQDKEIWLEAAEGLTAWALKNRKPIAIFDVQTAATQAGTLESRYEGLRIGDLEGTLRQARDHPRMATHDDLPPFSFMAVPVMRGGSRFGAVRCFAPTESPLFFSKREVALLEILAAQLADFWASWLTRRQVEEENRTWRDLLLSLEELNRFTQRELGRHFRASPEVIMEKALRITRDAIPTAEILDVRLLNEDKEELYFAATLGKAWTKGTREEIERRKAFRFPTQPRPPQSGGAKVVQEGELYKVIDVKRDKVYKPTFEAATMVYIAPISDGEKILGVLDLRTLKPEGFPRNADQAAILVGQQLGLCLAVTNAATQQRDVAEQLEKSLKEQQHLVEEQRQIYEDLSHQLRTPVLHGYERIRAVLAGEVPADKRGWNLKAIRGLSHKAVRVVSSLGIFAKLAEGRSLDVEAEPLDVDYMIRMLIEAAADTEFLTKPASRVYFRVEREGFEDLGKKLQQFHVDRNLLEQAIANIFDNARKYSYPKESVTIAGKLTQGGRLMISITNAGLKIERQDIRKIKERLWRSHEAREVTGEGTGIGLWIVEHIMQAHDGFLEIKPTTSEGKTEFRIIFPPSGSHT